jgi:nucleotide-binding universal stress UspA family protein
MSTHALGVPGRIVVGVDGSPPSKAALRWAARIAPITESSIEAVITWTHPISYGGPIGFDDWHPDADAAKILQDALDEVFGGDLPPRLEAVVRQGHARDVLVAASGGADMLVVGSRGHGGIAGLLLGSVSAACAEHARCPVLVVHGDHTEAPAGST